MTARAGRTGRKREQRGPSQHQDGGVERTGEGKCTRGAAGEAQGAGRDGNLPQAPQGARRELALSSVLAQMQKQIEILLLTSIDIDDSKQASFPREDCFTILY